MELAYIEALKAFEVYPHAGSNPALGTILKRIVKKTVIENNCWRFTGAHREGYGAIKFYYKVYNIHRLIGSIIFSLPLFLTDVEICHKDECHFRDCWKPSHLYEGDKSSNMQDSVRNGTFNMLKVNR